MRTTRPTIGQAAGTAATNIATTIPAITTHLSDGPTGVRLSGTIMYNHDHTYSPGLTYNLAPTCSLAPTSDPLIPMSVPLSNTWSAQDLERASISMQHHPSTGPASTEAERVVSAQGRQTGASDKRTYEID